MEALLNARGAATFPAARSVRELVESDDPRPRHSGAARDGP